jgi:hypothetical protein
VRPRDDARNAPFGQARDEQARGRHGHEGPRFVSHRERDRATRVARSLHEHESGPLGELPLGEVRTATGSAGAAGGSAPAGAGRRKRDEEDHRTPGHVPSYHEDRRIPNGRRTNVPSLVLRRERLLAEQAHEPALDLVLLRVDGLHADVHAARDLVGLQALGEVEHHELAILT